MIPTEQEIRDAAAELLRQDEGWSNTDRLAFIAGANWVLQQQAQPGTPLQTQPQSRCCGRCNGLNDLCITDMEDTQATGLQPGYAPTFIATQIPGGVLVARPEEKKQDNL